MRVFSLFHSDGGGARGVSPRFRSSFGVRARPLTLPLPRSRGRGDAIDNPPVALTRREMLGLLSAAAAGAASSRAGAAPEPSTRPRAPVLGLDVNLPAGSPPAAQRAAYDLARRTGVSLFGMTLSWSAAEPSPGQYRVAELARTARVLRQSGALLHLDLPLVAGRERDVPADLSKTAFDDSKLSLRLGRLLDALQDAGALRDVWTLSLGYAADVYFADKPEELHAFRRLFDGAVGFLSRRAPNVRLGVTTLAPTESPAPEVAAALHARSPILFYIYSPFQGGKAYWHRNPDAIDRDWKEMFARSGDRLLAFPEVSYSSSSENGSSPEKQAEFVRRLRRQLASGDARKLLFARYVSWRDTSAEPEPVQGEEEAARRRAAFLAHRGLQDASGAPKAAWRAWLRASP